MLTLYHNAVSVCSQKVRLQLEEKGLVVSGRHTLAGSHTELVEMVELADHPWFLGCQFHPEFLSRPLSPHPLFAAFVQAAVANAKSQGALKGIA